MCPFFLTFQQFKKAAILVDYDSDGGGLPFILSPEEEKEFKTLKKKLVNWFHAGD